MKIRIHGFDPRSVSIPAAMKPSDIYVALSGNCGGPVDRKGLIRASATTVNVTRDSKTEAWYVGMIIRARDADSYNHLTEHEGKLVLTAKSLEDGKIAEMSFFLAHPRTGKGLLASYHGSPSFSTLKFVCTKLFNKRRSVLRKAEVDAAGKDEEKRGDAYMRYKGDLDIIQLAKSENLKQILKEYKRLNSMEVRYSTVKNTGGFFRKMKAKAVTESEKFNFPPDFSVDDDLADEIANGLESADVEEAVFEGTLANKERLRVTSDLKRNMLVFDEEDYDTLLGSLTLDLADWAPTIQKSPVVQWLLRQLSSAATRNLLST